MIVNFIINNDKFKEKVSVLQREEQEVVEKLEKRTMKIPAPNDAIKVPVYVMPQEHKPIKLKIPQRIPQKIPQK